MKISVWQCHTLIVEDGAFSHKIDYVTIFFRSAGLPCLVIGTTSIALGLEIHWHKSSTTSLALYIIKGLPPPKWSHPNHITIYINICCA